MKTNHNVVKDGQYNVCYYDVMKTDYLQSLERNTVKYSWFKIFTKRVFLPLIAIQLVHDGGVTPEQIGIIAIVSAIVQIVLQVPAGYFADKLGNRASILLGCAIATPSPLFYIVFPNFLGGMLASVLFFGGYAFQSGALEAFMHDTLKALGREREYAKVLGRAQSHGLVGNMILLAAVPATYTIDHNLPFFIGFLSLCAMSGLAYSFTFPKTETAETEGKHPLHAARLVVTKQNVALFIFTGIMTGIATRGGEYRELLFESIGIAVSLYGIILSSSSIVGAVLGRFLYLFDRLSSTSFYMFDFLCMSLCLLLAGISTNHATAIIGLVLFTGYGRVRLIVFQAKLLEDITHHYKATLISALNFFNVAGELVAIAVLAKLAGLHGYSLAYLYFSYVVFGIGLILWLIVVGVASSVQRTASKHA